MGASLMSWVLGLVSAVLEPETEKRKESPAIPRRTLHIAVVPELKAR